MKSRPRYYSIFDFGYAVGAVLSLSGVIAGLQGVLSAIWCVAALTAVSGVIVAVRMRETLRR